MRPEFEVGARASWRACGLGARAPTHNPPHQNASALSAITGSAPLFSFTAQPMPASSGRRDGMVGTFAVPSGSSEGTLGGGCVRVERAGAENGRGGCSGFCRFGHSLRECPRLFIN